MIYVQPTVKLVRSPQKLRIISLNRPTTYLKKLMIVLPKLPNINLNNGARKCPLLQNSNPKDIVQDEENEFIVKIYAILESISDRIEMHNNVKEQRDNWNSLLLNSINMITLTGTTMAGVSTAIGDGNLGLKVGSLVLFVAATGLISIMNKIQPSQLAQEQRNAVRLFKQLKTRIEMWICVRSGPITCRDVEGFMEEVLRLDRAYPLPLLGAMLDKFPKTFEPAVWWPSRTKPPLQQIEYVGKNNGWTKNLEEEMRDIVEVMKKKDMEDYVRLGNKALKFNKMLAVLGPVLTGMAAVGAGFAVHRCLWGGVVATVGGSMAGVVNTIEHGGQVGMVFEMYRNNGGFFRLQCEKIESMLDEGDCEKREKGELFEMKIALCLGRSLLELRNLSNTSKIDRGFVDEFASKVF